MPQSVASPSFTEAPAWSPVPGGWHRLFGSFANDGVSFEWHDFSSPTPFDWGKSFHPGGIELCLNLAGNGTVEIDSTPQHFGPLRAGFYCRGNTPISATRQQREHHQFLTVEYSAAFLRACSGESTHLHPIVRDLLQGQETTKGASTPQALTSQHLQLVHSLRTPPVPASALTTWYRGKALELAAMFFFQAPDGSELFCHRQNRVAQARVEKVIAILQADLAEPPTLDQIGARVGCSPFYLSRTFSKEVGMTLPQFLRKLRMDRAAELLRAGKHNVTEAALEVGYSSLSHFSQAFHETFGVCPGLYPILPLKKKA